MKYSKEQQKLHLEKVYAIFSQDPNMSARYLWRELDRQGLHLNRSYVTKLLWQACSKLTSEEKRKSDLSADLIKWHEGVIRTVREFYEKIRELNRESPLEDDNPLRPWL